MGDERGFSGFCFGESQFWQEGRLFLKLVDRRVYSYVGRGKFHAISRDVSLAISRAIVLGIAMVSPRPIALRITVSPRPIALGTAVVAAEAVTDVVTHAGR